MLPAQKCLKGRKHPISDAPPKEAKHFILNTKLYPPFPEHLQMISIGMGCFWCSENLFWDLEGVYSTHVGYQMGCTPNPSYREVCTKKTNHNEVTRIVFDPRLCPLTKILKIFFETHDPTQKLGQGNDRGTQYRSGIYYYDEGHKPVIEASVKTYQEALSKKNFGRIQTEILPAETFYYAEDYHQQYDAKPGNREYCGLRPTGVVMPALSLSAGDDSKSDKGESMEKIELGADPKAIGAGKRLFHCRNLLTSKGKRVSVSEALNGKVIGYYHSAHWCGPCKSFTPKLAELYSSLSKEERAAFEIVFRSNDRSPEEFKEYFSGMPWLAVPFDQNSKAAKNANKHIPSLVIYAKDGKGITKDGVNEISKAAIRGWAMLDKEEGDEKKGGTGASPSSKPMSIPVIGSEAIMSKKKNGTTENPPIKPLRWKVDWAKANKICCFNRHFAESSGYFKRSKWYSEVNRRAVTVYYDSITGKPLFRAPIGRTFRQFLAESEKHGWPSFRDSEVIWDDVRVLRNGEVVSRAGTHLGHNLPDGKGNRYCINLVSIAGPVPTNGDEYKSPDGSRASSELKLVSLKDFIVNGHIDYAKLRTEDGRSKLLECLTYVERTDVTKLKNMEVVCFYCNAYNIVCLKGLMDVLDDDYHYDGHTSIARRYNFFNKTEHIVAGSNISLYDLENSIIRKFGDARVHAYLNCGAMGCPFFPDVWLTPENCEEVLEKQTQAWIHDQGAVILTKAGAVGARNSSTGSDKPAADAAAGEMMKKKKAKIKPVAGDEEIMKPKAHGTCEKPPMNPLRWECDYETADRICCFNRHFAEFAGYWMQTTFANDGKTHESVGQAITFYDSIYGYPVFTSPKERSWKQFLDESKDHGWPSFRDPEVNWENVRLLPNGEVVSKDGTHLGHNLPDRDGNRYCVNLVSVAGREPGGNSSSGAKGAFNMAGDKKGGGGIADIKNMILKLFYKGHVKDRRYLFKKYTKCFIGRELVSWLVMRKELMVTSDDSTRMLTRADAVAIGQDLLNTGFFSHVVGDHLFEDKHLFYRFQLDGGAQTKSRRAKKGPLLLVNNIFKWYREDFQAKYGSLFRFIQTYHPALKEDKALAKLKDNDVSFRFQLYDWRLNSLENGRRIKPLLFGAKTTTS